MIFQICGAFSFVIYSWDIIKTGIIFVKKFEQEKEGLEFH
jgi:hypothetical protein